MPLVDRKPPLVVIVGPTAVGKTDIAIRLARRFDGEIVSADSRLFYRGMDIGTAKPGVDERQGVPHHLIDVANPDETWSLALFQQAAVQTIGEIHARGRLPFLVGGTGQYVWAVVENWTIPAQQPDEDLRAGLEREAAQQGADTLHARLAQIDPQAAAAIDARNVRRTIRALEVALSTGRLFSEQRAKAEPRYDALILGLIRPREELYRRVDARIEAMLSGGLVDEVRHLLAQGYDPRLPTLSAIGYGEVAAYLRGEISLDEVAARIKRSTRRFVRRQANWFKPDDPTIRWFAAGEDSEARMARAISAYFEPDNKGDHDQT